MTEIMTYGGGCFWCIEAIIKRLKGVISVTPGYSGGTTTDPTYEEVCTGKTGHAEVVQIVFDPSIVSFSILLDVFFSTHDPTTPDRQGADIGTQYRSVIYYHSEEQKQVAQNTVKTIQSNYTKSIVTQILPFTTFYPAEDYHRDYYTKNSYLPYCQVVIDPKIQYVLKEFGNNVKENYK